MTRRVLYVASQLPTLSETFVYNELLALRAAGVTVHAASVRPPERGLGDAELDALADDAIPVYGGGAVHMLWDALSELIARPTTSVATAALALRDAACSGDVRGLRRLKVCWQLLAGLALARRVRPRGIGHIHAHMAHVPTTIAMYAARQLGVPFSFTGHANDLFPQRALLSEKLNRAAFVACISAWHRRFYQDIANVPDERLPIVRCGVAIPPATTPASRAAPHILSVGRLIPKKGFDVLLRALARLREDGLRVSCTIIGGGPQADELHELVNALQLGDCVELAGPRSNAEVRAAVQQTDLFVLPCRVANSGDRDGIPVVLMEAMAAGVCVVSGDLVTIRELVRDGDTGVMVPPGEVDGLVAALRDLIQDAARREQLAAAGRAWVTQEFSRTANVERLLAALAGAAPVPEGNSARPEPQQA